MDQTPQVYISSQTPSNNGNLFQKFKKLIFKVIFLLLFLAVLGVVFVNWDKIQNFVKVNITNKLADYKTGQTQFSETDSLESNASGKLVLKGPTEALVGSIFQTEVILSSDSKVKNVDAVILYDPKILKDPSIKTGAIFDTYPFHTIDQNKGRLLISGIKTEKGAGFTGEGILGSITFTALKKGNTSIKFQFTKSQTSDSNVLEVNTGKDILTSVSNLEILVK